MSRVVVDRLRKKYVELRETMYEIMLNRVSWATGGRDTLDSATPEQIQEWERHGDSMMACYHQAEAIDRRLRVMYSEWEER